MDQGNKRTPPRFVGREAIVTTQCLNGWWVMFPHYCPIITTKGFLNCCQFFTASLILMWSTSRVLNSPMRIYWYACWLSPMHFCSFTSEYVVWMHVKSSFLFFFWRENAWTKYWKIKEDSTEVLALIFEGNLHCDCSKFFEMLIGSTMLIRKTSRYVVKTLDNAESVKLQYRSLAKVSDDLSSSKASTSKMSPNWL